jgi:hypothetical protein
METPEQIALQMHEDVLKYLVDKDPMVAMRARMVRDCLIAVVRWYGEEQRRIMGPGLPGSPMTLEQRQAYSDLLMTFLQNMATVCARVAMGSFEPGPKRVMAAGVLGNMMSKEFSLRMLDESGFAATMHEKR